MMRPLTILGGGHARTIDEHLWCGKTGNIEGQAPGRDSPEI